MTTTTEDTEARAGISPIEARQKNLSEAIMSPWQNPFNDPIDDCAMDEVVAPDRRIDPETGLGINTIPHLGEGIVVPVRQPLIGEDWATPRLADEFTCPMCFLHVRDFRATEVDGILVCNDCAGEF